MILFLRPIASRSRFLSWLGRSANRSGFSIAGRASTHRPHRRPSHGRGRVHWYASSAGLASVWRMSRRALIAHHHADLGRGLEGYSI